MFAYLRYSEGDVLSSHGAISVMSVFHGPIVMSACDALICDFTSHCNVDLQRGLR